MLDILPWKRKKDNPVVAFRKEMDRLFDRFFDPDFFPSMDLFGEGEGMWFPKVDVSEGRKTVTVKAEIPGVDTKDIDISLDGRRLIIKGEKKQEHEEKDENYHRLERSYGYFSRTIELPAEVDPNKVDATHKRGVLKIKLRKAKESETKRIKVVSG